jgi:hypothetical protein
MAAHLDEWKPNWTKRYIATRRFQGAKNEYSALEIDRQTCVKCTKLLGAEGATTLENELALFA